MHRSTLLFCPQRYWHILMLSDSGTVLTQAEITGTNFSTGDLAFSQWASENDFGIGYAMSAERLETADPRLYEAHRLMSDGAPCLPLALLTLDPLLHDLNAIELRRALSSLRARDQAMYDAVKCLCGAQYQTA